MKVAVASNEPEQQAGRWSPYAAYRDSGVQWLGEVPEGWEVRSLKRLASLRAGMGITSDSIDETGPYPVYGGNGIRGYGTGFTHEGRRPLIGRQGALCGNVTMAQGRFWASEHAVVASPAPEVDADWLRFLLVTMDLNQYSMSAAQPGLAVGVIQALESPLPPLPEQRAIAAFLDRETAKIDALVAKKERLLELLDEKRTALISRAVTKGLDPDVPMNDSGVEWLGEVPEGWKVVPLKRLLDGRLEYGANQAAEFDDRSWPRYVRITDIDPAGHLREEIFKSLAPEVAHPYLLAEGDILLARSGATVGKSFVYRESWGSCAYAGYLIRARCDRRSLAPAFLKRFTESEEYWQWLGSSFIQATIQNVSAEKYGELLVPLPPLPEQRAIAAFLDRETARIDALKAKIQKAIELLKEYRTALISAAVTGKIDVRGEVADPAA